MRNKVVGILGGMGPESTVYLFRKIIEGTQVQKEQEHLRIIIDNNPQIPDRTEAILGKGPSPLPELEKSIRNLEQCEVDMIGIPCNTVFYYYESIQNMTQIPIIHLISECAEYIRENMPRLHTIGLLATTGTIVTGLYQKHLSEAGITLACPSEETQSELMSIIYGERGIKAGDTRRHRERLLEIATDMIEDGAGAVITGCTEIEVALEGEPSIPLIYPIQLLASAIIKKATS
ncbi:MAG: amino acid racemase [Dehalococcoidales bacterium]|nr:MAG: amino acid racemase [Dehalococcoidales bacterium]